ncbi:MAG: hybrid sensor histidine kinase/response regulator [Clostridia bacterium]|nr:hybrid sensor histidine kinase/response regulator [Clostridia bacterium]
MDNFEELKSNVRILLVDDDLDYIQVTAFFLKTKGYNVEIATSGMEAINKVKEGNIHIVLLDYYMPGLTGEDVINKIREFNSKIIIILQTGFSGQQPPEETLQRLDIQNYHDKSDGADKLLLQVMSAVRIFDQQTKVYLSEYRAKAIGGLIKGIAEELKSPILTIGAGIEATKVLIESTENIQDKELLQQVNQLYLGNKECLKKIDKILSTVIIQSQASNEIQVIKIEDMAETLEYLLASELRQKHVKLEKNITCKDEYMSGKVSDLIFILTELIHKMLKATPDNSKIELGINSAESAWYISLKCKEIPNPSMIDIYLVRNVLAGISGMNIQYLDGDFVIEVKKIK